MSGYVDHAWRHRPKALGGTDPIPGIVPEMSRGSLVSAGRGSISADVDEFVFDSGSYGEWDPEGDTFASYTDDDGVYGLEILRTGHYLAEWSTAITYNDIATNPTRLIPPYVGLFPNVLGSGTHFNATGDPWPGWVGPAAVWMHDSEFSLPGTSASDPHTWVFIGGSTVFEVATLPKKYTLRIISKGTAHKWAYSGSHSLTDLRIFRLGKYV